MLFGKLPDEIFRPLSGTNRNLFEKVLKHLHRLFFDEDNPESDAPRKDLVLSDIHQVLVMEDDLSLTDDEEGGILSTPAQATDYIFRRLIKAGWLELEEDGYNTNVIFNPNASLLLESLLSIEQREKQSYGRVVTSILVHLSAAVDRPKEQGIVFLDAVAKTREFSNHLRGILYSLKEVQDKLVAIKDPKKVLSGFFELFVDSILIADYKTLNSEDNPFRYRSDIREKLKQAIHQEHIKKQLVAHYEEHYALPSLEAEMRFIRDADFIDKVFRSVDRRLDGIDSFRFRLEGRVAETVRFIDRTAPGTSTRLRNIIESLGNIPDEDDRSLPPPAQLIQHYGLSPFSIRAPRGKKEKPKPLVLRNNEMSEEDKRQDQIIRDYMQRRAQDPIRVVKYLDRQMGSRTIISAQELVVESVEDLISFLLIRQLHELKGVGEEKARAFHVIREEELVETEWVICDNFIVERVAHVE